MLRAGELSIAGSSKQPQLVQFRSMLVAMVVKLPDLGLMATRVLLSVDGVGAVEAKRMAIQALKAACELVWIAGEREEEEEEEGVTEDSSTGADQGRHSKTEGSASQVGRPPTNTNTNTTRRPPRLRRQSMSLRRATRAYVDYSDSEDDDCGDYQDDTDHQQQQQHHHHHRDWDYLPRDGRASVCYAQRTLLGVAATGRTDVIFSRLLSTMGGGVDGSRNSPRTVDFRAQNIPVALGDILETQLERIRKSTKSTSSKTTTLSNADLGALYVLVDLLQASPTLPILGILTPNTLVRICELLAVPPPELSSQLPLHSTCSALPSADDVPHVAHAARHWVQRMVYCVPDHRANMVRGLMRVLTRLVLPPATS